MAVINLKALRWQNFLSAGNQWSEIAFDSPTTMIVGENGAGKSTMIEALTYALFGKAFRKINLPQLVNSITNKNCLVELDFQIGSVEYQIRRGQKPKIFDIYIDGKLHPPESHPEDQKYLEDKILRMNFKTFSQNDVLGPTNYTPFMQLSAGDRRAVVENVLDISVFSIMNTLLKEYISENSSEINDVDHAIDKIESKIDTVKEHLAQINEDNEATIAEKTDKIAEYEKLVDVAMNAGQAIAAKIDELTEAHLSSADKVRGRRQKLKGYRDQITTKIGYIQKEIEFFDSHNDCPTCQQEIDPEFKTTIVKGHTSKTLEYNDGITKIDEQLVELDEQIKTIVEVNDQIVELNDKAREEARTIKSYQQFISSYQAEIESLRKKKQTFSEASNIEDLTNQLKEVNKNKESLVEDRAMYNVAAKMLKDSGIKAKIISQYVPVINQVLNQYLEQLNLFVEFHLDENFNETVKSRFRDAFSYESFSEGEKARLNLAILLTWRTIARMKNSSTLNIVIFDEVLDGPLNSAGVDSFMEIVQTCMSDQQVYIITHSEKYNDMFNRMIRFEKNGNFGQIAEVIVD